MFAAEIRATALTQLFRPQGQGAEGKTEHPMTDRARTRDAETLICEALAEMTPSTAAEIAEATELDPVAAADRLDELARQQRVMFNPLTKRFSLPRPRSAPGLAA